MVSFQMLYKSQFRKIDPYDFFWLVIKILVHPEMKIKMFQNVHTNVSNMWEFSWHLWFSFCSLCSSEWADTEIDLQMVFFQQYWVLLKTEIWNMKYYFTV